MGAMSAKFKTTLKIIGAVCLVLFAIELLIDPISYVVNAIRIAQIRRELPAAKARWEAQGITSYTLTLRGGSMSCLALDAKLFIEQGQTVRVLTRQKPFDETLPFVIPATAEALRGCGFGEFTAPAMFKSVEQILQTIDPAYEELIVSFDDTSGIVTRYQRNAGYQHGLLSPGVGECCLGYEFSDFQPDARGTQ